MTIIDEQVVRYWEAYHRKKLFICPHGSTGESKVRFDGNYYCKQCKRWAFIPDPNLVLN